MRSREEIELFVREGQLASQDVVKIRKDSATLEVLLDIRELLLEASARKQDEHKRP